MKTLIFAFAVSGVLLACTVVTAACSRAEDDSGDFAAFDYSFMGTGNSNRFSMDGDCGITSAENSFSGINRSGSGVAPAGPCNELKSLATSPQVISQIKSVDSSDCPTDDYPHVTVRFTNDASVSSKGGCTTKDPFRTLLPRIEELRGYITYPTDSGALAADAMDGG
jgi:hypothetical protein